MIIIISKVGWEEIYAQNRNPFSGVKSQMDYLTEVRRKSIFIPSCHVTVRQVIQVGSFRAAKLVSSLLCLGFLNLIFSFSTRELEKLISAGG